MKANRLYVYLVIWRLVSDLPEDSVTVKKRQSSDVLNKKVDFIIIRDDDAHNKGRCIQLRSKTGVCFVIFIL